MPHHPVYWKLKFTDQTPMIVEGGELNPLNILVNGFTDGEGFVVS